MAPILRFPPIESADEDGILAIGGDLDPDSLLLAYSQGIFPWPVSMPAPSPEYLLAWFCPPKRAVLIFKDLHIPRSLERARKSAPFRFTLDQAFTRVIEECSRAPRPGQDGTWITPGMVQAYIRLHELGHAHSVEAWQGNRLVGGVYGVDAGGAFAGESMFYLEPNASKLALLHMIDHLSGHGLEWIDIQMVTPHMERLGAKLIPRARFLKLLSQTRAKGLRLFDP